MKAMRTDLSRITKIHPLPNSPILVAKVQTEAATGAALQKSCS